MILIQVHLLSANTGLAMKLGELRISNDGRGTDEVCDYDGEVMRKPDFKSVTRRGRVEGHRRHQLTIWHLVGKMLKSMGYV